MNEENDSISVVSIRGNFMSPTLQLQYNVDFSFAKNRTQLVLYYIP